MELFEAQDLVRWAAPKSWTHEIIVHVAGLLYEGVSAPRTARAVQVPHEEVARVRRVLRAAGVGLGRGQLRSRWRALWEFPRTVFC